MNVLNLSFVLTFMLACKMISESVSQSPNQHGTHVHSNFGKIRRQKSKFVSSKPRVKQLDTYIDEIVQTFKRNVLRLRSNKKLDLIFVIDASFSVTSEYFKDEIRFVSRFVSGIPVSMDTTRVAVITFADIAELWVDQVTADNIHDHKCSLLGTSLPAITYASGSTYTYGGLLRAKEIMDNARVDSKKVILLITDGRSNGGDPRGVAQRLRREGIEIFTFGVHSGNVDELTSMASEPKLDHVYILKSFAEFESVARRALHADAEGGDYIIEASSYCNKYCGTGGNCCHRLGACRCGTTTGIYECVCDAGYFGFGLLPNGCIPCPAGTYKVHPSPGGPESCTPCPDRNMVSPNGSSSLDQCTCKRGYNLVDDRCDVIRCPEMVSFPNGRFEGLYCDNRYRSTCQFFCDEGYDLLGDENVVCGIDGTWNTPDGEAAQLPTCQIRYCPSLAVPEKASKLCSKEDSSFQTLCTFECQEGFAVVGSRSRYCQSNTEWDGTTSNCEEIRCSFPRAPSGGKISENCQGEEGHLLPYNEVCTMSCPPGFALSVSNETRCIQPNTWTVDTSTARCIDNEAPSVACPDDIVMVANPQLGATDVTWEIPTPTDNSGRVRLIATPAVSPPAQFYIGDPVVVTYTAVDEAGLGDSCNFTVTLIDEEPPMIDSCNDPEPFVIARGEIIVRNAVWEEPVFSDNSGAVLVNRSRDFGDMPFGQSKVTYIATDATGNMRTCVIVVSVQYNLCPPLEDPMYGHKSCLLTDNNLVQCELICDSLRYGMAMVEFGIPFYTCQEIGEWEPPLGIPKDCSHQRYSSEIEKSYRASYSMTTRQHCNETEFLKSVRIKLTDYFNRRVQIWCATAEADIVCVLMGVDVQCLAEKPPEPEQPAVEGDVYGPYGYHSYGDYSYNEKRKRRRRSVDNKRILKRTKRQGRGDFTSIKEPIPPDALGGYDTYEDTYGETEDDYGNDDYHVDEPEPPPLEPGSDFTDILTLSDEDVMSIAGVDEDLVHKLEVTVTVSGQVLLNDEDVEESRMIHGKMSEFFGSLDVSHEFKNQLAAVPIKHINTSTIEYITYDADSYDAAFGELKCPLGTVLRNSATCVNCPVGTYFDVLQSECVSCDKGYYQDAEAQLSCKACPAETSTSEINSRSLDECKDLCDLGTYSSDGLERCIACSQNTYADMHGLTGCAPCPENTGTARRGSTSLSQCGRLCEPGTVSFSGIEPCYPCPIGTYQFEVGLTFCYECPDDANTDAVGSETYTDCFGVDRLLTSETISGPSNRNSALLGDENILGILVNSTRPFTECFKDPCQNGECQPSAAGYICNCYPGYTGGNCEIDVDECAENPCENGANCTDLINEFSCSCQEGFEGDRCETEINECKSTPCLNGAICVDLLADFSCICFVGFTGELCEEDIDDCVTNPCVNGGSCVDLVNGYECQCAPGFNGTRCEFNVDDCEPDPCLNGGECIDGIDQFACQCPTGFEGETCEVNIDDCVAVLCDNGGTCIDLVNDYRCLCAPAFTGEHCGTELHPDFDLGFQTPNTYHHTVLKDGIRNMTEVTVAFYMQSNNTETEGTPFSYGIGKGVLADIFTLTNLNALTLYVNGEAVVTDSRKLNDGRWYHVVVTWTSEGGQWKIYINRILEVEGEGLQAGTVIPGGGVLVIGQEQDCLGGCFSPSQEFIGKISQFNLYDRAMSGEEVASLYLNCVGNKGTVKAWPDALGGIVGQVDLIKPPSFCQACPDIIEEENLKVTTQNEFTKYLECQPGHKFRVKAGGRSRPLPGALLRCGNQGIWRFRGIDRKNIPLIFLCVRLPCENPSPIEHGSTDGVGHLFGDSISYVCDEGYVLNGVGNVTCLANQLWSSLPPTCVDVNECDFSPCHDQATCTNSEGSYQCSCNVGWTGDGFECMEIDCGSPAAVEHGEITGTNFKFDGVVEYLCNVGYNLIGVWKRTCQTDSEWSDDSPVCEIVECVSPETVAYAIIDMPSETYGSVTKYTCESGYQMEGEPTRVCQETGAWSGSPPVCNPVPCPPLDDLNNGEVASTGSVYLSTASYSCNEGYYLVGQDELTCLATRAWGDLKTETLLMPPVCLPEPCFPPDDISNAYYVLMGADDFVFGSHVEYNCNEGYNPLGENRLDCQSDGMWNNPDDPFKCNPVPCSLPEELQNGKIERQGTIPDDNSYTFGHSIAYICLPGFDLVGTPTSDCQSTGTWSAQTPMCEPVHCGMPPEVDNAAVELQRGPYKDGPHFKSQVIYKCDEGYRLEEAQIGTRLCESEAEWTGNAPVCERVPCGTPPTIEHGSVAPDIVLVYQDVANYECDVGFETTDSVTITCMSSGDFTAVPSCGPVPCGPPPHVQYADMTGNHPHAEHAYQSQIEFQCHRDFIMDGMSEIECLLNGTWSPPPTCFPITCDHPDSDENGFVAVSTANDVLHPGLYDSHLHPPRAAAISVCNDGFELLKTSTTDVLSNEMNPIPMDVMIENMQQADLTQTQKTKLSAAIEKNIPDTFLSETTSESIQRKVPFVIRRCTPSGKWDSPPEKCHPMLCLLPPRVWNAEVASDLSTPESRQFQAKVTYRCSVGYFLDEPGIPDIECVWKDRSSSVGWVGRPSCLPVPCLDPIALLPEHTTLKGRGADDDRFYVYLDEIEYSCVVGYRFAFLIEETNGELSGNKETPITATCQADSSWSREPPTCVIKDCGDPPPVDPNGYIDGEKTTYGSHLSYYCNDGYYTISPHITIDCKSNGDWSSTSIPPCLPVDCPQPDDVMHGRYTGDVFTFMNTVNYTCDQGYDMLGPDSLICEASGFWNDFSPLCIPVDCGDLPEVTHSLLDISTTVFESFATYECLSGYEMNGEPRLECLSDGMWDFDPPRCQPVDCGYPGDLKNGIVLGEAEVYKSIVYFVCDIGHDQYGDSNATCQASGTWSTSLPDCLPVDCGTPSLVPHAYFDWDSLTTIFQTRVSYTCNTGFEMVTDDWIVCQADAVWSGSPLCVRVVCPNPDVPEHGMIAGQQKPYYEYEDAVSYECERGYPPAGPTETTCTAYKTWSNYPPLCEPVDCGRLPEITHGRKGSEKTLFMAVVEFSCDDGYKPAGDVTLECTYTGDWDKEPPSCEPVSCGPPPSLRLGNISGGRSPETQLFMETVSYQCNEGYYMSGRADARCAADRTWKYEGADGPGGPTDGGRPACKKIRCQQPPAISNGSYVSKNYTYGDQVKYACDVGYEKRILSPENVHCTANEGDVEGFYRGVPPTCPPVSCGMPATISNGIFVSTGTTYQKTARYSCNDGYLLNGHEEIICQSDRTWSGASSCEPRDCGSPQSVANSFLNVSSTFFPTKLHYECKIGFNLFGPGTVECLTSGDWSDVSNTSCEPVPCGPIQSVANSTSEATGNVFRDTVTYVCTDGFQMFPTTSTGRKTLKCQSTGNWEELTFTCNPKSCGKAPAIEHGKVEMETVSWVYSNSDSVYFPDSVVYSCDPGYEMKGSAEMSCLSNETFSPLPPSCPPVVCGVPDAIPNAILSHSGITFGHSATHHCDTGHVIRQGDGEITSHNSTCGTEATWVEPPPTEGCERVECPYPPSIEHGTFPETSARVFKYMDTVTYACDPGYEADPHSLTIMCKADKLWQEQPVCNPVNCGLPFCPHLASCSHTGTTYLHTATAVCDPGHEFVTDTTVYKITCNEDSQWGSPAFNHSEVDVTSCRPHSCGRPESIQDGNFVLNDRKNTFGSSVSYWCDVGHEMPPDAIDTLLCQTNKQWGPSPPPVCSPKNCGPVTCPTRATCNSDGTSFLSTFAVLCDPGHELAYDIFEESLTCLDTGKWSELPFELDCKPVRCPMPLEIAHGKISGKLGLGLPKFQSQITYDCDNGYYMQGNEEVTCLAKRSYSSAPPKCHPVSCGKPSPIDNGAVHFIGITFKNNATYQCHPGYNLFGEDKWKCEADGNWKSEPSSAKEPVRARRSLSGGLHSGEGSGMLGDSFVHARSFETVTADLVVPVNLPVCDPVPCGSAPNLLNGMAVSSSTNFVFGESVSYICDDGFYLTGSSSLLCLEDGTFGPEPVPICERVSCGQPPYLENSHMGAVSVSGGPAALYVYEDRVVYTCEQGYEFASLNPVDELVCASDKRWAPAAPDRCPPVSCGDPPQMDHSTVTGDEYTFGKIVSYDCDVGYDLVGMKELVCLSNKQWNPAIAPTCAPVTCPNPIDIEHGVYKGEFIYLKTITYNCDRGFELNINISNNERATLTCMANRKWDSNPPRCKPVPCGEPPAVTHGSYSGDVFTYGSEVIYSCNVGHEMEGDAVIQCLANRMWSLPIPKCTAVSCDHAPHVANSDYKVSDSVTYGNTVFYECHAGYDLLGAKILTCTESKSYDFAPPICAPVSCGHPDHPTNGHVLTTSGAETFRHNVTYACDDGYEMPSGDLTKVVSCTADRTWSDIPPLCLPVTCGRTQLIDNGLVDWESDTFMSLAHYSCHPGYILDREGVVENCHANHSCLVCQANRIWGSGDVNSEFDQTPQCLPILCGEPPAVEHALISVDSFTFESVAEYKCEKGRELYPSTVTVLQCQANYKWGPEEPPVCRRVACDAPEYVQHGFYRHTSAESLILVTYQSRRFLYGDTVSYQCSDGYRFSLGNSSSTNARLLTCMHDGIWDRETPNCEPVPCSTPPIRHHGHLQPKYVDRDFVYLDTILYQCDEGYEWTGQAKDESGMCASNGRWEPARIPECTPVVCGADPIVGNGHIVDAAGGTPERRVYQSRLHYQCLEGYEMYGPEVITCDQDRRWSPDPPHCDPVSCNIPPNIAHGKPTLKRFATSILLSSRSAIQGILEAEPRPPHTEEPLPLDAYGFAPTPPNFHAKDWRDFVPDEFSSGGGRPQQADSEFSGAPQVRRVRSAETSDETTASLVSEYVFKDVLQYLCDSGYQLNSSLPDSITCKSDREWTTPRPICEPVPCDPLPEIPNARRIGDKFEFGKQVKYSCDEGYEFLEESATEFECDASGSYVFTMERLGPVEVPSCSRVSCGEALHVENAVIREGNSAKLYEDTLTYVCMPGHNLRGSPVLTCQSNANFDNPAPFCEPVSCVEPILLPHTSMYVTGTTFKKNVTYTCEQGYIEQSEVVTCGSDGRWTPSSIVCERVDCGTPPVLNFGVVDINGTKYGDVASYHCRPGYIASGTMERVCLANTSWSYACASCLPVDCGTPEDPVNGYHTAQGNYTFGNIVLFSCDEGYFLDGAVFSTCNEVGNWSAATPSCARVSCGGVPLVDDSVHISGEMRFGDKITFECEFGHNLTGLDTVECTSSGFLSNPPPTCPLMQCRDPPHIRNAHIVSTGDYFYGEWATYECDTGHEFPLPLTVVCTGFGVFMDVSDYACLPVECPSLSDIPNGQPSSYFGFYNDVVAYRCEEGYHIDGEQSIRCAEDSNWSFPPPQCLPVECGYAPDYPHTVVAAQRVFTFKMKASYECVEGFEFPPINGVEKICQADGTFTPGEIHCVPVTCIEILPVRNGAVTTEGITYEDTGRLACHDGYQLSSDEDEIYFFCQADRSWSRDLSEVSCNPVPCDTLPPVDHSVFEVTYSNRHAHLNGNSKHKGENDEKLSYGASAKYTCDNGYYLDGNEKLDCLTDGSWNLLPPSCLPVSCGRAPETNNARTQDKEYTFGMVAHYKCDIGYMLTSDHTSRECLENGSFSEESVVCERIPCPDVPRIENGKSSASTAAFSDVVSYDCDVGYELRGNSSIYCGSRGQFTSSPPSCIRVKCSDLPRIYYGEFNISGKLYKDKGTLKCATGFQLSAEVDEIKFSCQADRSWSYDFMDVQCDAVACERLRGIENGDMTVIPTIREKGYVDVLASQGSFTYQTRLSFTCNSGYDLVGAESIICTSSRMWSDNVPRCTPVKCLDPPDITNAYLTTFEHTFGQNAIYDCKDGHQLTSSGNVRTCKADGNFSNHHVACTPVPCPRPPAVENGKIVSLVGRPAYRDTAVVVCDDGYHLAGEGEYECLASGTWSEENAVCLPVQCGIAPIFEHAMPKEDTFTIYHYGDIVTYTCDRGYQLSGIDHISCGADASFDDTSIVCEPVTCEEISPPTHSSVSGGGATFGEEMTITCDQGYKIKSSEKNHMTVRCQHTGYWSQEPSKVECEGIRCEPLPSLVHGSLELSHFSHTNDTEEDFASLTYPSTVSYRCDYGYILLGRSKRNCLVDGSWAGSKPFCQPVDCGTPPRLLDGKITGLKSTTSGSLANYECNLGYHLVPLESKQRRCMETGSWSGVPPSCSLVSCGVHGEVENAKLTHSSDIYFGDIVSITCDKGYRMTSGNATRPCRPDGNFEGDKPVCERIECGNHPVVYNGYFKPESTAYYGDSVNITCEEGFKIENGDSFRTCQEDGSWSGKLPYCESMYDGLLRGNMVFDDYFHFGQPCGAPPVVGNKIKLIDGEALRTDYEHGSVLEFCCSTGFIPRGNMVTQCENGNWSNIPECVPECRRRCLHNGVCIRRGHCSCQNGWAGSRCHRPVCPLPCLNRGFCSAPYTCTCPSGWTGTRCQTAECNPLCSNGGKCVGPNQCNCPYGYRGSDCSQTSLFLGIW
ncbi:sushi, von Willebrand factor type A, EGF and pentraxin domain-containing protein 1-like isoform X2 [Clavelina lepadiformis]|uniref:sushi, von Willebrand factor type A, EGF and pentraxin domain-containing protein 1-like isoform X2 n=1 Tax=Clavelina lepadiformis TaxID=159417 RepID=UPI004041C24D